MELKALRAAVNGISVHRELMETCVMTRVAGLLTRLRFNGGDMALDDYTFEVTLKVPDPTFEAKLVATPCYPTREDIAEAAGDQWGKDWKLCVYNGPFCMSELVEDNKMVWTKNPHYWDADNTHLETINWYIVTEDSTASTMDLILGSPLLSASLIHSSEYPFPLKIIL